MTELDDLVYERLIRDLVDEPAPVGSRTVLDAPDRRDGRVYRFTPELKLAVEVALSTGRPLLLRGEPGSGKSSLAAYVARNLNWRYYEHVVTARTQAQALLWEFDAVRRLGDAQLRTGESSELYNYDYVEPGVLWWVFDRASACLRGAPPERPPARTAEEQNGELNAGRSQDQAVLLIDEIDKADPDMPNGLLVPLGSNEFLVTETGTKVERRVLPEAPDETAGMGRLLVIITTNEERELPPAFLRRCIVYKLRRPGPEQLVEIARRHFEAAGAPFGDDQSRLATGIAQRVVAMQATPGDGVGQAPSTAEFLDALRACHTLGITPASDGAWSILERTTLRKRQASADDEM